MSSTTSTACGMHGEGINMIENNDWRLQQELEHLKGKSVNGTDGEEIVSHTKHLTACIFCREQV